MKTGEERLKKAAVKVELLGDFSPDDLDFFSKGLIPWEVQATEEIISYLSTMIHFVHFLQFQSVILYRYIFNT